MAHSPSNDGNRTDAVAEGSGATAAAREEVDGLRLSRRAWTTIVLAAAAAWCLALLVWAQHGLDETLVRQAAARDPHGLVMGLARVASKFGMAAIAAIHLAGIVASFSAGSWRRHRKVYLLTLMSLAVSGLAGDVLKDLIDRPRPAVEYAELRLPAGASTTDAFPSGHSTKSVALALPFLLFVTGWARWRGVARLSVAGLALSVCASRVLLGAHFLSDVLGGVAMALSGLPLATLASNALLKRTGTSDMERAARIWAGVYAVLVFVLWKLS